MKPGDRITKWGQNSLLIPPGTQGTVEWVEGVWAGVRFDNGWCGAVRLEKLERRYEK